MDRRFAELRRLPPGLRLRRLVQAPSLGPEPVGRSLPRFPGRQFQSAVATPPLRRCNDRLKPPTLDLGDDAPQGPRVERCHPAVDLPGINFLATDLCCLRTQFLHLHPDDTSTLRRGEAAHSYAQGRSSLQPRQFRGRAGARGIAGDSRLRTFPRQPTCDVFAILA